jgi:hypothetical protein
MVRAFDEGVLREKASASYECRLIGAPARPVRHNSLGMMPPAGLERFRRLMDGIDERGPGGGIILAGGDGPR